MHLTGSEIKRLAEYAGFTVTITSPQVERLLEVEYTITIRNTDHKIYAWETGNTKAVIELSSS